MSAPGSLVSAIGSETVVNVPLASAAGVTVSVGAVVSPSVLGDGTATVNDPLSLSPAIERTSTS